jgi:poly-beta-1,6-N-acetyl-D-glucosamine biosynthesis protein PgaD
MRSMGKSGPRDTDETIIDSPELKTGSRSCAEGVIALALWGVYIYFIYPILELIWDFPGLQFLTGNLMKTGSPSVLGDLLKISGSITLIVTFAFAAWTFYNFLRFSYGTRKIQNQQSSLLDRNPTEIYQVDPKLVISSKNSQANAESMNNEVISA